MSLDPIGLDASLVQAALDLGVSVELLQSQIAIGDMLAATVLPPQNGQDLIQILGQTVVAQLPPTVRPGETLVLQVTGFSGNQIIVQNLGTYDPQNPVPLSRAVLPPELPPQTATLTTIRPAPIAPPQNAPAQNAPAPQVIARAPSTPIAPPPAVFAAASVMRSSTPQRSARITPSPAPPRESDGTTAPRLPNDVDVRIAAAKSASGARVAPPVPAASQAPARVSTPPLQTTVAARAIAQTVRTISDLLKAAGLGNNTMTRTAAVIAPQAPQRLLPVLQRLENALPSSQESADPRVASVRSIVAFVSRLNLNNDETLPSQIASFVSHVVEGAEAKLQQLLVAYQRTEDPAMPTPAPAKTPPENASAPQSNGEEIETVPRGAAQVLRNGEIIASARAQEEAPVTLEFTPVAARAIAQPGTPAVATAPAAAQETAAPQSAPAAGVPLGPLRADETPLPEHAGQSAAVAHVAERAAAAEHDLKTLVLSLLRNPPSGVRNVTTLTQALNETVITLTGTQLNVISANLDNPNALTLPLPAFFYEGGKPAYLRIERDGAGAHVPLDGDNFHVSFILDTANLGTVAVDLQSSGRTIKVDVKTERSSAASSFSRTLDRLRTRLETLKYRVASATASTATPEPPRHVQVSAPPDKSKRAVDPARNVDLQA